MPDSILVIDDDKILLQNIKRLLDTQNYQTETINVSNLALERIEEKSFSCILLDVRMPGLNGLDLLDHFNAKCIHTPVIMISGQSNIETAVQSIKRGAFDFIEKPIDPDRLLVSIKNAIEKNSLVQDNRTLSEANINFNKELEEKYRMVGKSKAMLDVFEMIKRTAEVDAKVLITGESGTGKELVAWAIHHNGTRRSKPYIKVNCASIPNELLESELFGHKKGSFTGAVADQKGKFQAAEGGTLFLDEIGEMDFKMQAKLLRVLQGNEIEVVGETTPRKVDVRIIAATNQNLEHLIKEGRFREDLFHRLNLIRIHLQPLKKRKDDILPLADFFLRKLNSDYNKRIEGITARAEQLLVNHPWSGNIRELRNIIEKMIIFSSGPTLDADDVLMALGSGLHRDSLFDIDPQQVLELPAAMDHFEKKYLEFMLNKCGWRRQETARALGIDRSNLYKKLKRHGL